MFTKVEQDITNKVVPGTNVIEIKIYPPKTNNTFDLGGYFICFC